MISRDSPRHDIEVYKSKIISSAFSWIRVNQGLEDSFLSWARLVLACAEPTGTGITQAMAVILI